MEQEKNKIARKFTDSEIESMISKIRDQSDEIKILYEDVDAERRKSNLVSDTATNLKAERDMYLKELLELRPLKESKKMSVEQHNAMAAERDEANKKLNVLEELSQAIKTQNFQVLEENKFLKAKLAETQAQSEGQKSQIDVLRAKVEELSPKPGLLTRMFGSTPQQS